RVRGSSVRVNGADGHFYVVIGQNFGLQWRATIDGKDLGSPLLLDGYSAGWRVSQTGSFTVTVAYRPQRTYTIVLIVSAFALLITLSVVAGSLIRGRGIRKIGRAHVLQSRQYLV